MTSAARRGCCDPGAREQAGLWTIGFRRHLRTRHGRYCYPLTVIDEYGGDGLACQGLLQSSSGCSATIALPSACEATTGRRLPAELSRGCPSCPRGGSGSASQPNSSSPGTPGIKKLLPDCRIPGAIETTFHFAGAISMSDVMTTSPLNRITVVARSPLPNAPLAEAGRSPRQGDWLAVERTTRVQPEAALSGKCQVTFFPSDTADPNR